MTGRILVARALVVLGVVLATAGLLAVYVRLTALDDNEARSLAHALIARPDLRAEVASTSVDRLYANVDVASRIKKQLPAGERGLAGPLSAALRGVAEQGRGAAARRAFGAGALDGRRLPGPSRARRDHREQAARRHRLERARRARSAPDRPASRRADRDRRQPAQTLPSSAGQITIFRSDDLASAQRATRVLNAVANWFWVLAIAAWAAAIWIFPRRTPSSRACDLRRPRARGDSAARLAVDRRSLRRQFARAGGLGETGAATTWSVLTARLADSAWTTIGVGVVAFLGLWLQGSDRARRTRLVLAPVLRAPRARVRAARRASLPAALVGPTIETREWRGLALVALGSAVGVEILRRTTAREFPGASLDEAWASLRKRVTVLPEHGDEVDRLERLARLHESGALDDEGVRRCQAGRSSARPDSDVGTCKPGERT